MASLRRYSSLLALALALIDTLAIYTGEGFLFIFREKQAAFLIYFSVAAFIVAGVALMMQKQKPAVALMMLGVFFAVRAGMTVPDGGELPQPGWAYQEPSG